ncbi:uncharacterized protein A4U43_C01F21140 [Asparagus officinalis]|uniref:Myb-like domain-containing protein n=1 Tax=Asparagus officinalis TaxID=4686 RepID=A0A5P1FQZ8_ASPOF|nr:protein ALWAYS EARLY 3-like isoform X2 [Asparagus officinalis]ONK80735.1 uncharacterized protein A4U43_C01F21140 [Asparagus officinalis]
MGPTKMSRMVNKRTSKASKEWPDKVVTNANKSKVKKRKLSDMLDYRWNKEELKQFYAAFRTYGKNWRKVAELIGNRSIDMVESLYNLNKAYLNLPEGMATADGFIAMMTDHYNNLDGSDNEYERKGAPSKILKPVKSSCAKRELDILKRSDGPCLQNQSVKSSHGCKTKKHLQAFFTDCWPRAVQKRTPRVPITHSQGDGDNFVSASKCILKSAHDEHTHTEALTLTNGPHGGDSSLISGFQQRSKLIESIKEMCAETDMTNSSDISKKPDDNCLEGCSGRRDADNGLLGNDIRVQDADRIDQSVTQCSAVDPLQILADVSLNIGLEGSACESLQESSLHGAKQKGGNGFSCHFNKHGSLSANPENDNSKFSVQGVGELFSVQKSNLPGSVTGFHELVNSRISYSRDTEYSSTDFNKTNESETLLANPESHKPKILVEVDQEYPSSVRYDEILSKEAKLQQVITPDENTVGKTVSDAEEAKGPHVTMMEKSFAENIAEIEGHAYSSLDESEKKENVGQCLGNQNGIAARFCEVSGKNQDACFQERELRNPAKFNVLPKELHDKIVLDQSLDANGISLNPSFKLLCITSMKQATGETVNAILKATPCADEEVASSPHKRCSQPCMLAKVQSRESDIKTIADLTRALDKKEEVLKELRQMNDVVYGRTDEALGAESNHVIEHYRKIVKLLNEVNDEVASASYNLRQRNTYIKNSTAPKFSLLKDSTEYDGLPGTLSAEYLSSQNSSLYIEEIVTNAREKARTMVDTAVLTMSSLKEGEDAHIRIRGALDSAVNDQSGLDSKLLGTRYSCSAPSAYQNRAPSFTATANAPKGACLSSANESEILSALMSECIATMFMIQNTSERRFPPADIARILEHAVESLQPRCSQNLPVYRDIEKCMGYIKTQMLSLIETPNTSLPTGISV